jgi:hypothetical protein
LTGLEEGRPGPPLTFLAAEGTQVPKRRLLLIGLAAVAAFSLAAWWWGRPAAGPRLRAENYPQVRAGMPLGEVEALLGGPPGNYGRYAGGAAEMTLGRYPAPPGSTERIWCDDCNRLEVYFDAEGRVVGHHRRAGYGQSHPEGVFGWLRSVTGL